RALLRRAARRTVVGLDVVGDIVAALVALPVRPESDRRGDHEVGRALALVREPAAHHAREADEPARTEQRGPDAEGRDAAAPVVRKANALGLVVEGNRV